MLMRSANPIQQASRQIDWTGKDGCRGQRWSVVETGVTAFRIRQWEFVAILVRRKAGSVQKE